VGDLLEGKQIFVKNLREFNALYVVAEGLYDRKIEFIAAGNVYYTRRKELNWLLKAAEKEGIRLEHSTIDKITNARIVRVCSANKDSSIKQSSLLACQQ
jgi:hypothetical protein